MKQKRTKSILCAFLLPALLFCACTDGDEPDLPDGKYPMTFTAQVDGLTATRATTTDDKTSWEASDPVAISMDGGISYKKYKISEASSGTMIPDGEANTFYWSKTKETLAAWYPVSCIIGSNTGGGEVSITDQHSGFGTLENILHAPAKEYTYSSGGGVAFSFRHALAKVKVTLKKGDGIEESDLSNATVTFTGYTAGALGYGGMTGSNGSNSDITPKTETVNGASTYTTLVIPQQMQGEKFIKITVGAGNAARDYFYTPANSTDANLEAGKQYNYIITVKKTGLQVESVTASWNDSATDGNAEAATFKIHLATFSAPENTSGYKVTDANGSPLTASDNIYTTSSSAINISLSANENYTLKKFLTKVTAGICKQKVAYTADTRTYTYTFYDIHSDLWLDGIQAEAVAVSSLPTAAKVGDYFYADGTWSGTLTTNSSNPCIGIVFKVGAGMEDNVSNYNFFFMDNAIHGYVIALQDTHSSTCAWGGDGVLIGTSTNQDDFAGYSNTQKIIAKAQDGNHLKPDNAKDDYPAAYYISEYDKISSAPQSSSGWYFPSTGQLKEIYNVKGNIHNDMLSLQSGDYLSSSEFDRGYPAFNVGCVSFANGNSSYKEKDDGPAYVRAILTF